MDTVYVEDADMRFFSTGVTILNPHPNFPLFSTIYFALSVTRSPLVPSRAARTVTRSPDKSPDRPHD